MVHERSLQKYESCCAGIALLAVCSFAGCGAQLSEEISAESALQNHSVASLMGEQVSEDRLALTTSPPDRALLDQTIRLEKALSAIQSQSNENGWQGTADLRNLILGEFRTTENMILERLQGSAEVGYGSSLERLFESVHVVHGLFKENGLASSGIRWGESAVDGSMSHLYGLQAQLMLTRMRMTGAE